MPNGGTRPRSLAAKFIDLQPASAESYMPMAGIKELQGDYQGCGRSVAPGSGQGQVQHPGAPEAGIPDDDGSASIRKPRPVLTKSLPPNPMPRWPTPPGGLARQLDGKVDAAAKDYESALLLQGNISFAHQQPGLDLRGKARALGQGPVACHGRFSPGLRQSGHPGHPGLCAVQKWPVPPTRCRCSSGQRAWRPTTRTSLSTLKWQLLRRNRPRLNFVSEEQGHEYQ